MCPFTRDQVEYWTHRPADHTVAGLFAHGPLDALPITTRLVKAPHYDERKDQYESIDHERLRKARMRFARALAGHPVGRNRRSNRAA